MSRKRLKKNIFSYAHPLLIKIGSIIGVLFILCAVLAYAGYRGIGPLDWLFSPPEINLLIEDTGSYGTLYQTQREAAKSSTKGFLIDSKGRRRRVKNLADIIFPPPKPPYVPNTKIDTGKEGSQYINSNYSYSVENVSNLLLDCDINGRNKGVELQKCLCESLPCSTNPIASNIANAAKTRTEGDGKIDCVELIAILEQMVRTPLTACGKFDKASQFVDHACADSGNHKCTKEKNKEYPIGGFKVGDDMVIDIIGEKANTNNDHIATCVEPMPDGSCRVCEANYNNDGKVTCNRIVKPDPKVIRAVWRKYRDVSSDPKIVNPSCY